MFFIFFYALTNFTISFILVMLTLLISKKSKNFKEKFSPFECGFNFLSKSRTPFSMRFFLIAIIFIIFDVEIALIVPLLPAIYLSNLNKWTFSSLMFMFILILGIALEWKENSFEWKQ